MKVETVQGAHEAAVILANKSGMVEAYGLAAAGLEDLGDLGEDLGRATGYAATAAGAAAFLDPETATELAWQTVQREAAYAAFWYGVAAPTAETVLDDNPLVHLLVPAIEAARGAANALASAAVAAAAAASGRYTYRGL